MPEKFLMKLFFSFVCGLHFLIIACSSIDKIPESTHKATSSNVSDKKTSNQDKFEEEKEIIKTPKSGEYEKLSKALKSGSDIEVINACSLILSQNPYDLKTLNALAMYHFRKGRNGISKIILDKALEKHPDSPIIYNNYAVIYIKEGKTQEAVALLKKSLSINPNHREAAINLGTIYVSHLDFDRARPLLTRAYKSDKPDKILLNNYGVALRGTGDHSMAEEIYSEVVDKNPDYLSGLLNYAILLVDYLDKGVQAEKILKKVKYFELGPDVLGRVNQLEMKIQNQKKKKG